MYYLLLALGAVAVTALLMRLLPPGHGRLRG